MTPVKNEKKVVSKKDRLVASLERKIKNKKALIKKMAEFHRESMKVRKEELEILEIQFNALKK